MDFDRDVTDDVLSRAVDCILGGGILIYPTDTVYGLGGDAARDEVSDRLRQLKGSAPDRPLLILTDSWARVADWVSPPDALTRDLMAIAEARSLTILFSATKAVPKGLIGTSSEIGIRLCRYPFCARLIQASGRVISSTSANRAGGKPPLRPDQVEQAVIDGADLLVDGGALAGVPSTVVRPEGSSWRIVREGSVTGETLDRLLG